MSSAIANQGMDQLQQGRSSSRDAEVKNLQERFGAGKGDKEELRKASQEFEAIFIQRMWEQMRETVPQDGYLHSDEKEMYMSMFDEKVSVEMAKSGGIGLADMIFDQLSGQVEKSNMDASSDTLPNMRQNSQGQNLPTPEEEGNPRDDTEHNLRVQRILDMNIPSDRKAEMLAGQIESAFGGKKPEVPELMPDSTPGDSLDSLEAAQPVEKDGEDDPQSLPPLQYPVQGQVSSGFGWREDPFTGEQAWHAGIDFAVEEGTPVKAGWPGEVVFADKDGGYGNKVILEHPNGWKTVYAHNSENLVQEGDRVDQGQEIARSGNTGRSTGPHLHFEVRQGDMAWDPNLIKDRMLAGLDIGHTES